LKGTNPYIYLNGTWLKRTQDGLVRNVNVQVAVGVNQEGYREILGVTEAAGEDRESWRNFLHSLKERDLKAARLIVRESVSGCWKLSRILIQRPHGSGASVIFIAACGQRGPRAMVRRGPPLSGRFTPART